MQTHALSASCLWQPGEFARRMLGERPSPVPPTRDLWPPPQEQLSISTLHLAYQHESRDELLSRRASTLPLPPYSPTTIPIDRDSGPRLCSVGTNTDPPPTFKSKLKKIFKRNREEYPSPTVTPPMQLTMIKGIEDSSIDSNLDSSTTTPARRAFDGIKKVMSGAKYRIAPDLEPAESPKIVYETPKPGDRMLSAFGKRERRKCFQLPSRDKLARRMEALRYICRQRPRSPAHHRPQPLQITQV